MKHTLTRLALYCAIALVPACGSRKAAVSIQKDKAEQTTKEESKGQVAKENEVTDKTTSSDISKDTDEKQESKITELFNENGTLKSRITELLNTKQTSYRNIFQTRDFRSYVFTDSVFNNTIYKKQAVTHYVKSKTTDRNSSIWLVLSGLAGLALGVWLSPKIAKWVRLYLS